MCEYCTDERSKLMRVSADDPNVCHDCGEPAVWVHLQWSVLFHVCSAHLAAQQQEWQETEQEYFKAMGFTFVSEFFPIAGGMICGYRLAGSAPGIPGPTCGAPATHVQLESDRRYYCAEHKPE